MLTINGVSYHVVDRGRGSVLLLVHGFPLDHSMWEAQLAALGGRYRVIAPDLRGFGRSGGPDVAVLTMEQLADDLAALLDALSIRAPITFCGLSMGGYVAWQFWKRHRARLGRLILCDTRAAADSAEAAQARRDNAERVLRDGTAFLVEGLQPKLFAPWSPEPLPGYVAATRRVMLAVRPATVAAALRGMAQREDCSALLGQIDVPALLVCGAHDAVSPPVEMQDMARRMPAARCIVIADAGHMAPLEQPGPVTRVMEEFLAET